MFGVEKIIYSEAKIKCEIFKIENDRVWKNLQRLQKLFNKLVKTAMNIFYIKSYQNVKEIPRDHDK